MKADTLLKKTTATLGAAVLTVALGACSTHRVVDTTAQTTGEIRTEQAANNNTSGGETLGTVAAPANTQGAAATSTPAVISGPAAVDKSGNLYTSSAVGSAGNGSGTGLNTNVQIRAPRPAGESSVVVTQSFPGLGSLIGSVQENTHAVFDALGGADWFTVMTAVAVNVWPGCAMFHSHAGVSALTPPLQDSATNVKSEAG